MTILISDIVHPLDIFPKNGLNLAKYSVSPGEGLPQGLPA